MKTPFKISLQAQQNLERILLSGLFFILLFAPLAFGAVHVWAYTLVMTGILSLWLMFMALQWLSGEHRELLPGDRSIKLACLAFLGIIVFQLTPLPLGLISLFSARTAEDWSLLRAALSVPMPPHSGSLKFATLTYAIHPTIMGLIKVVTYLLVFLLVFHLVNSPQRIRFLIIILIASGVFQSVYGFKQAFSQVSGVWWYQTGSRYPFIRGTFISSNHLCYYLEIVFSLCLGYLLSSTVKSSDSRHFGSKSRWRRFKSFVTHFFAPDAAKLKHLLHITATILLGVTLILSGSRGGIISIAVSLLCLMALFLFRPSQKRRVKWIPLLIVMITLGGLYVGMEPTLTKFTKVEGLHDRLETTQSILPMIRDYPLFGVGWGNFSYLYPRYVQDYDRVAGSGYAHNDWVESFIESGVFGGLALAFLYGLFLTKLIRRWRVAKDPEAFGVGAGVIVALISTGIHNYFDFSLRIPANPLTLATIAALGYSLVSRPNTYQNLIFKAESKRPKPIVRTLSLLFSLLLIGAMMTYLVRHFMAEIKFPTESNATLNLNWNPYLTEVEQAIGYNSLNAGYHLKKASYYINTSFNDTQTIIYFNDHAIRNLAAALALNPVVSASWYQLGMQYRIRSRVAAESADLWLEKADLCMEAAVRYAPKDVNTLLKTGSYWLERSTSPAALVPADARRHAVKKFKALFKQAMELRPGSFRWIANRVWQYYPDINLIGDLLPENDSALAQQFAAWSKTKR